MKYSLKPVIFYALTFLCLNARASEFKIFSFRGAINIFDGFQNHPVSRGFQTGFRELNFTLGRDSGLVLDGPKGAWISIYGPSSFSIDTNNSLQIHSGEVFIQQNSNSGFENIFLGNIKISDWNFLQVILEASNGGERVRVTNLAESSINMDQREVKSGFVVFNSLSGDHSKELNHKEMEALRQRHIANRHNRDATPVLTNDSVNRQGQGVLPNPGFFEGGFLPSISKLYPSAGSTFGQNLGGLGVFAKYGSQKFFGLDPDLTKRTRQNYMLATSLRYSLTAQFLSVWMQTYPGFNSRFTALSAGMALGIGWQGLFLDSLILYSSDLSTRFQRPHKARLPLAAGLDLGYRIDLEKWVDSDLGVLLGGRSLWIPMTRNQSVGSTQADQSQPQEFSLVSISIFAALSLRF